MKNRRMPILLTVIFSTFCLMGNSNAAEIDTELELSTGYRLDDFDWNIAGNTAGANPNILSELTWTDLEIFQVKAGARAAINRVFFLRGSLGYGRILNGDNQDSDFSGQNRTQEYSRSNNSGDDGSVWDAGFGFGCQFTFFSKRLRLIPLAGYSYSEQNLTMTDGLQTVSEPALAPPGDPPPMPLGPIAGLDSTYETRWYGPWLGIELWFQASPKITLFGTFEYHWADYEAVANWNLADRFAHPKSFEHEADGTGIILSIGGEYVLREPWFFHLNINYQGWSTDPGIDRLFLATGAIAETRLNEVNWDSHAIMLGLAYRFHSPLSR